MKIPSTIVLFVACFALSPPAYTQQQPEYLKHFDPANGFKPAQVNLTEIVLQIAGSLECYGSPEPYLRHMQKEHQRVSRLFEEKMGKTHTSRMPTHMTDAYVDRFARNWSALSAPLGLDKFAKDIGGFMREGIMGTRQGGTVAVQFFNDHQKLVAAKMRGEYAEPAGFDQLRVRLERDLEFGKDNIDMGGYETSRRDAVSYAYVIDGAFRKQFKRIDATAATPEKAETIKKAVAGTFLDLGYMAQSELEIGILELSLRQPSVSGR